MVTTDVHELRTWPNDRLLAFRDEMLVAERRARWARVLADRVLDERGVTGGQDAAEWVQGRDTVSSRTARAAVEVARRLEELERKQRVVTPEEMQRRHQARELHWWRSRDGHWLHLRGRIPDLDRCLVESILNHGVDQLEPPPGQAWDLRARRGADALVQVFRDSQPPTATDDRKRRRWTPTVVVHVGSAAQPTVNGIPVALDTAQRPIKRRRAGARGPRRRRPPRPQRAATRSPPRCATTGSHATPPAACRATGGRSGSTPTTSSPAATTAAPTNPAPAPPTPRAGPAA